MVRTFLKVYMELGSYCLFLQEQKKDIIIMTIIIKGQDVGGGSLECYSVSSGDDCNIQKFCSTMGS